MSCDIYRMILVVIYWYYTTRYIDMVPRDIFVSESSIFYPKQSDIWRSRELFDLFFILFTHLPKYEKIKHYCFSNTDRPWSRMRAHARTHITFTCGEVNLCWRCAHSKFIEGDKMSVSVVYRLLIDF